jgi:hypothetical protein
MILTTISNVDNKKLSHLTVTEHEAKPIIEAVAFGIKIYAIGKVVKLFVK